MSENTYGTEQRVRLCLACGATMEATLAGGDVTCGRCGTLASLPARELAPLAANAGAAETEEERQARLGNLRKQAQHYNRANRYATVEAPEGYEELARQAEDSADTLGNALARYREAFARCAQRPDAQSEQAIYWLTWKLNNLYVQQNQGQHAWSVIHTSLDVLTDAGYQHILRTMAADKARKAGELDNAEAWLALCDPAPGILDLDTDYRTSLAAVHGARGEWDRALSLVGLGVFDVPIDPSARVVVGAIRVTALEKLGRGFEAEEAMRELLNLAMGATGALKTMLGPSSLYAPGKAAWDRLRVQEAAENGGSVLEDDEMLPPGQKLLAGSIILVAIAALFLALGVYQVKVSMAYKGWKPATARLDKVITKELRRGDEDKVGVGVRYTYKAKGATYRGNLVDPGERWFIHSNSKDAQERVAKLRDRRTITVHYNPAKPSESAINRAWIGELVGGIFLFLGTGVCLLVAWLLLRVHRRRHRAHDAWKARQESGA